MTETVQQLKSRIFFFVVIFLTAVIGITAWSVYSQHEDTIAIAERQTEGYARALAEHSESAFSETDRILRDVLRDLEREGGIDRVEERRLYDLLKRQTVGSPQIGALFVVDRNGTMVLNTNSYPSRQISVADRDYFQHYLHTPDAGLTLSRPVVSRIVGRWRFNLMRPLPADRGGFSGILAAAFEVEYFKRFFSPVSLGPRGRILLVRTDGVPLVFEPYSEGAYDTDFRPTILFSKKLPAAPSGTYRVRHNTIDRTDRIVSYQRLSRFPVVAVVALHEGDVLKPWLQRSLFQGTMSLLLCVVIIILTRILFRHLDMLGTVQESLVAQQHELLIKAAQIDAASDAILLVDEQGVVVRFNQALCAMTGYSAAELEGVRLQSIEPPESAVQIAPNIQMLLEQGQGTFESSYLAKDGRIIPTEVRGRAMESDGRRVIVCIVRDITRRKLIEQREETRHRILEEMATGRSLNDLLEMIVHFVEQQNPGVLCSVLLADADGQHLRHIAAPSLPAAYNKAVDGLRIAEGMGSCGTAAYRRERVIIEDIDRHPFWKGFAPAREAGLHACWSEPIISAGGELLGTFAMYFREQRMPLPEEIQFLESAAYLASIAIGRVREESQRQVLEEQLQHIQKIEAIGQLAGGIAHDFNNLLTPIIAYADLVKRGLSPDHPQSRRVEGVLTAAHKAKDLTQKLLSFGRKQMLSMETMDLNEVVNSFHDILRRTIRESIVFDVTVAPGGAWIRGDRVQLEQILINLAVNAQDAIDGVGTISISTGHVLLDDEFARLHPGMLAGRYILLSFGDTGCGMDEETLRHIYEPFFTTKAVGHGTGLGLATVYGVVKQHEGYIETRSHLGGGTTFLIYLPEAPAAVLGDQQADAEVRHPERGETGKRVLLVEDNAMVREMLVDLLESNGYLLLVADSPGRALDIERNHTGAIDLVVTDVIMPGMNGMELFERLNERRPGVPVLYISGYTSDVVIHNGTLEETVNFLKKPFTAEQFLERIRLVIGTVG